MKDYEQYIDDVINGRIVVCQNIKLAVERFLSFKERDDMYFDSDVVDEAIEFIGNMKHFLGKCAGKNFHLEGWQQFLLCNLLGLKWRETGLRVCRETYIQIARKAGKDAFMAALSLYMLIADGEAAPEIACLANSRDQARILFSYITNFAQTLDPKGKMLKYYRNYVSFPLTNGMAKVYSSDSSKLDGLNISLAVVDEYHEAKDRKIYDVMKSSMGMREQPLMVIITTAGFNLESPCHDFYELSVEILHKIKTDDTFFPFLFTLDEGDDWRDESNFIKVQPNLGVTVTSDFMKTEVQKAKNDATAEVGVKTKTFNMWCQAYNVWIPMEQIAQCMTPINLDDFKSQLCYIGVDLSTVSDFSSLSVMFPKDDKFYFKTFCFLPEDTLKGHPQRELYMKFIQEGTMVLTPGNVTDYDYIINLIGQINEIADIEGVYYDKWNATQFAIKCTELGYNMCPFSQGIGNFNIPTKEMERLMKSGKAVIDRSSCVLWQFGNVKMKLDYVGNAKPTKESNKNKIDSTISMISALGGFLKNPVGNDCDLIIL